MFSKFLDINIQENKDLINDFNIEEFESTATLITKL